MSAKSIDSFFNEYSVLFGNDLLDEPMIFAYEYFINQYNLAKTQAQRDRLDTLNRLLIKYIRESRLCAHLHTIIAATSDYDDLLVLKKLRANHYKAANLIWLRVLEHTKERSKTISNPL